MFMGEYHHNIDEKGRVVLPGKFRELARDKVIITRGIEKCLYLYTTEDWEKLVNKLNKLSFTKKDARTFTRAIFAGATLCEFDRMGRINITSPLVNYAGLTKECVIIGVNDRIEIWDEKLYNNFLNENSTELELIAENLFEVSNETL
jgi:MraZ protein